MSFASIGSTHAIRLLISWIWSASKLLSLIANRDGFSLAFMSLRFMVFAVGGLYCSALFAQPVLDNRKIDGYRGIWFTLGQYSKYGDKYSGGLGTYTAKHRPLAIYSAESNKTFFVYGGTTQKDEKRLLCMISYYDHETHSVPKPTVVVDKIDVIDPHDDPSLAIDKEGYIWVFVSGRAKKRPGFKYRSDRPYSIDSFVKVTEEEMTYPQPLWDDREGFFNFFTKYTGVRELYYETSEDGVVWSDDAKLAGIVEPGTMKSGHYQVSGQRNGVVCTFFNRHPNGVVDKRTDLYYAQSKDRGRTWTTIEGKELGVPMTTVDCGARVIDYASQGKNVYLKDLNFDSDGNPVCLYITSDGHEPGPQNGRREWWVTRYRDGEWMKSLVCSSDHNYDMGSLYMEGSRWAVIAPTGSGPQLYQSGGDVVRWVSEDLGMSWKLASMITRDSPRNHNYVRRPVNARDPFYSFWADGDPAEFSESLLYFSNSDGSRVFQLPYTMSDASERPMRITP